MCSWAERGWGGRRRCRAGGAADARVDGVPTPGAKSGPPWAAPGWAACAVAVRAVRAAGCAALVLAATGVAAADERYAGIGRPATAKEIAAWDIDVRPDFKGLPPGAGSVAQGQVIWEAKCASCHAADGSGNTTVGKKMNVRDLRAAEVQKQTDVQLTDIIAGGKKKMPAYGKKLTAPQIQALIAFIRTLKK